MARNLLSTYVVGLICTCLVSLNAHAQPNFVVIVADDMGYGDLGCTGSSQIATPAIDRIADEGVFCTRAYVAAPVCSPSRIGLLTGRFPASIGVTVNPDYHWSQFDEAAMGLPQKVPTLPERLKAAGYRTGLIGKWHLGDKPQFHPTARGFDEFLGIRAGSRTYWHDDSLAAPYRLESNFKTPAKVSYLTDDLGTEAVDFIQRNRTRPFFLMLSFTAPHVPLEATREDLAAYAFVKDKPRQTYCAMMRALDRNIGRVLAALSEAGLERDTCVVFFSDNGGHTNANASCNAPLRGCKDMMTEGGVRTPLLLRWPAELRSRQKYAGVVSVLDLMPTFLAAAGSPAAQADKLAGSDILPWLKGTAATPGDRVLFWRFDNTSAVLKGDSKLILVPDRLPQLYDLAQDPTELDDRLLKDPEQASHLVRLMGRWEADNPAPLYMEGPGWPRRHLEHYDFEYPLTQPPRNGAPAPRKPLKAQSVK